MAVKNDNFVMRQASRNLHQQGMIHSPIPGRTDKIPMKVPAGAYVLPADIPSALGQGNTIAGAHILNKMFSTGPLGNPVQKAKAPPTMRRASFAKFKEDGGEASPEEGMGDEHVPIVAAGGEYIIHPEVVRSYGGGDIGRGHKILDQFVLHTRKENIKTLKGLPGPKK